MISSTLKGVDQGMINLLNALIKGEFQDFPEGGHYLLIGGWVRETMT